MRCSHEEYAGIFGAMDGEGPSKCSNEATWEGRCPEHGGEPPSVEDLLRLLAKLTGWGDQSLSVTIGFKRARVYDAQDDSHLDENSWGYVADVRLAGTDQHAHAQAPRLDEALFALAQAVVDRHARTRARHEKEQEAAVEAMAAFKERSRTTRRQAR